MGVLSLIFVLFAVLAAIEGKTTVPAATTAKPSITLQMVTTRQATPLTTKKTTTRPIQIPIVIAPPPLLIAPPPLPGNQPVVGSSPELETPVPTDGPQNPPQQTGAPCAQQSEQAGVWSYMQPPPCMLYCPQIWQGPPTNGQTGMPMMNGQQGPPINGQTGMPIMNILQGPPINGPTGMSIMNGQQDPPPYGQPRPTDPQPGTQVPPVI